MTQGLPDKTPQDVKSPKSLYCQHQFNDLMTREVRPTDGTEVWFYCMNCTMMIKKILKDESEQL